MFHKRGLLTLFAFHCINSASCAKIALLRRRDRTLRKSITLTTLDEVLGGKMCNKDVQLRPLFMGAFLAAASSG